MPARKRPAKPLWSDWSRVGPLCSISPARAESRLSFAASSHLLYTGEMPDTADKTFYLETFGCQMNVHDSEKVVGTLMQQGYRQVQTVEEAGLVLYNTCSIRDKAEQKVFNRLSDYKKYKAQGKIFGVLGCVA